MNWLIKFAKNPRSISSIAPSSKSLGHLMTKNLPSNARVLELGSGSGAITECILNKLDNPSLLTSVEIDDELCNFCKKKFPEVNFINKDIQEILSRDESYDFILSGVPFVPMQKNRRQQNFNLIKKNLNPGGSFIMYQYSLYTRKELRNIFGNLQTNFTPWNLPPAFVFTCKKI
ncbi:MAG: methyltransferase domain-containing protein [Patescibacteria group bacterium]|nr:methyltransferase domain-containing protein [Patescibacteria group bacterium]